ncbi:MAG: class I SAM-dependent methyltransferase, partial [Actinomycetes bacterium]
MDEVWETHADWWQARFTRGVDAEYTEQIVPTIVDRCAGMSLIVDVGCGEGQIARALARLGANVVGVDGSAAQLAEGVRRGGGVRFLRSDAVAVPLRDGCADAVVACLIVEHVGDLTAFAAECARLLRSGGTAVLVMNHPLLHTPDACWVDDHLDGESECYWRIGPYLPDAVIDEEVDDGVTVRFWHRPLS